MAATLRKIGILGATLAIILGSTFYVARIYWCEGQLDTPIFQDGDLSGNPYRVIAKLGSPLASSRAEAGALLNDDLLRELFLAADAARLAQLGDRQVKVLIWEQNCLGSTIWRFVVVVDPGSDTILAVGGESSFYAPVFLGGLIFAD